MKRRMKKLMSLLISVSMVFSVFTMPVYATPADGTESEQTVESETTETEDNTTDASEAAQPETEQPEETQPETTTVEENFTTYIINANDIDVSGVSASNVVPEDGSEVDESSPTIATVEEELNNMKVLNEDEEGNETKEALTDEQIQNILYMYQKYLDQWEDNANLLGVQTPFFLSYNDDNEDGLGILGEMLVLAGHTVDEVRSGDYSYDDLMGMIQNFYYADQYGVEFYGDAIAEKRDEVLKKVEDSNAETFVQKLLVINDWLAHNTTFDMAYIMNMGRDEPIMEAENPQKHEHYDDIYDAMYELYYDQIEQQFHDQIFDGIEADLRQQYYEKYIWNIIYNQTLSQLETDAENATDDQKQQASDAADDYMDDNEDAISEDAVGFVEKNIDADVAKQMVSDADAFIEDAENDGVEVGTDENGNSIIMTVEEITQNTMANEKIVDLDGDGENDTTANDAIPIYAEQAAAGLTDGILGAWEGNHIGVLAEGTGVCAGYSKAFAYLVQYMCPEQYGINGAGTDMSVSENWKTSDELYYNEDDEIDISQDYVVDLVRITFDADVTMFGEDSNFGETHFWNAVKVDGEWYYVDPCYTDIYVECMSRDRVEIDGTMNHMYFMFSHSSAKEMYQGNMKEIATLYDGEGVSDDTSYEDSWFARIASNTYISDGKAYYMYDSSDQLSMMREYRNLQSSGSDSDFDASDFEALMEGADPTYKLVYHEITDDDTVEGGADSDYTTLIEFNHEEEEESSDAEETADTEEGEETTDTEEEGSVALVYNPGTKEMEENELLTELFAQYKDECDIYPSIKMTTALYGGKLYFNLSNCILSYDLESGAVEKVREYNTVYGKRDDTVAFGGMGFSVVDSAEDADLSVTNHPIAALTIKDDGQMYVSIATNYAFISGKSTVDDSSSYGYEFEESNYNPDYSTYMTGDSTGMESMGYSEETNDNDEFMWSAVFVDTMDMTSTCSHTYESVTVEPTCGRDGFTENRCTKCGAAEADSRVVDEGSALDAHHYVHFDETYYTKDDDGEWNTGECYVCTVCGFAIEEPDEPRDDAEEEEIEEYEKEKAIWDNAVETAGHSYEPTDATWSEDSTSVSFSKLECSSVCPDKKNFLDCLLEDDEISVTLKDKATATAELTDYEGECTTGATAIYTASGEAEGYKFTAVNKIELDPGEHAYEGEFEWTEVKDDDGNITGYTATADLTCPICGDSHEDVEAEVVFDEEESKDPTCEDAGKNVYVATAAVKDEDGNVIGSATETKEDPIPATGHDYVDGYCTICGAQEPSLEAPAIVSVYSKVQTSVKVTWSAVDNAQGYELWRATSMDAAEDEWVRAKTVKGDDIEKYTNSDGDIQYTNQDLTVGQTYYYKVRAFKMKSGESDLSNEEARIYSDFSAVNYMPAAVVFDNVYSNATFRIRILWNEVDGSHGYQIWRKEAGADDDTYKVIKTLGDKNNTLTDNQGATTAYSNTDLEAGKKYTYKMRAFYIPEEGKKIFGAYSDEITVAVMPEATTLSVSSSKAGRASLSWKKVSGAAGYQVCMATSKNGSYSIIKSITDGSTTSYTKSDLKSGSTYYFKVRAYVEVDGKKTFGDYTDVVSVKVK